MNITAILGENSTNESRLIVIFSKYGRCFNATVTRMNGVIDEHEEVETLRFANAEAGNNFYKVLLKTSKFVRAECNNAELLKGIVREGLANGCKSIAAIC